MSRTPRRARTRHQNPQSQSSPKGWRERIPWIPALLAIAVIASAFLAVEPIRDAASLGSVSGARLELSNSYLVIAPISDILDTLTLMTPAQHISLVAWAIVGFVAFRMIRAKRRGPGSSGTIVELMATVIFLASLVAVYAAAATLPRPMARLTVSSPDAFLAEFHMHTMYSHDGRPGWGPEDVRAWARGAGFDVAYISDHRTVEGAEHATVTNPTVAGNGTMLLPALEAGFRGEHVNLLGAGRRYKGLTTPDLSDIDESRLAIAGFFHGAEPVLIETMPGTLAKVVAARGPGTSGVRAIEVVDGSPRGLAQTRRDRGAIVRFADSLNLALVEGSDNHGWGRTAPAWTVLHYEDWRSLSPDSLGDVVDVILRLERRAGTQVVERVVAGGSAPIAIAVAPILVPWRMLTTLSTDERVAWLIWVWLIALMVWWARGWRQKGSPRTGT